MARLSTRSRNALADRVFGLPESRGYPMPNKAHARLAKSGASRAKRVGNITAAQKKRIDAKANRLLHP